MTTPKRSNNRNEQLLESAAELFATGGYRASTMRNIAVKCGMLPGSIYYHYPSKDALLLAVYEEGFRDLTQHVEAVINPEDDPWVQLENALTMHLQRIVKPTAFASVLIRVLPEAAPAIADQLVAFRERYEDIFRSLFQNLPLAPEVDRNLIRVLMVGAANHTRLWFKPGKKSPRDIARQMIAMIKTAGTGQAERNQNS